jgi:hypothetical protein
MAMKTCAWRTVADACLAAALAQVTDLAGATVPRAGSEQGALEVGKAMKAHGA